MIMNLNSSSYFLSTYYGPSTVLTAMGDLSFTAALWNVPLLGGSLPQGSSLAKVEPGGLSRALLLTGMLPCNQAGGQEGGGWICPYYFLPRELGGRLLCDIAQGRTKNRRHLLAFCHVLPLAGMWSFPSFFLPPSLPPPSALPSSFTLTAVYASHPILAGHPPPPFVNNIQIIVRSGGRNC